MLLSRRNLAPNSRCADSSAKIEGRHVSRVSAVSATARRAHPCLPRRLSLWANELAFFALRGAKSTPNPSTAEVGRQFGTRAPRVGKDGRKWVVNFYEPNGEYSSWKPTDLEFVSRPAPAPAPAAGAGGSGGANGNDDDDDEPDNDADNNEEDGELAEHNDGAAPASVDGWNRNDYFSLPQRTRCWSRHAPRRARDPRKRGLTLMAGDEEDEGEEEEPMCHVAASKHVWTQVRSWICCRQLS